jgi:hypothetical protein
MATESTSNTTGTATTTSNPNLPATEEAERAHVETLKRIANLLTSGAGRTATSDSIDATTDQVRAHDETTKFFTELHSRSQEGTLTREEVNQRWMNWALEIPGMREKYDDLPDNLKAYVDQFKSHDLTTEFVSSVGPMKFPPKIATAKKIAQLKAMLDEQYKLDKGERYPNIVENNGDKVAYVEKLGFENWGETVKNTPSVRSHLSLLIRLRLYLKVLLALKILSNTRKMSTKRFVFAVTGIHF